MPPKIIVGILLLSGLAAAQSSSANPVAPATPSASSSFLSQMLDPLTVSMAAYDLAQVAQGTTAWHFTAAGKSYTVSPAQQTGIAAAATIGAAAIAHKWPKLKTAVTIVVAAAAAYYGGKAYAQTQAHGTPAAVTPAATGGATAMFTFGGRR